MIGAAMQAPLAGLALILELTHSGFGLMVPMMATTVIARTVALCPDGYSIYSARLPGRPTPRSAAVPGQARTARTSVSTASRGLPATGRRTHSALSTVRSPSELARDEAGATAAYGHGAVPARDRVVRILVDRLLVSTIPSGVCLPIGVS
jgi:hypothetical protein